jgi:hypothetical protein
VPGARDVWYGGEVFGLTHGEIFLVVFVFLTVVLTPYSGRAGSWIASLLSPKPVSPKPVSSKPGERGD